jgi:hypothetical protein
MMHEYITEQYVYVGVCTIKKVPNESIAKGRRATLLWRMSPIMVSLHAVMPVSGSC